MGLVAHRQYSLQNKKRSDIQLRKYSKTKEKRIIPKAKKILAQCMQDKYFVYMQVTAYVICFDQQQITFSQGYKMWIVKKYKSVT